MNETNQQRESGLESRISTDLNMEVEKEGFAALPNDKDVLELDTGIPVQEADSSVGTENKLQVEPGTYPEDIVTVDNTDSDASQLRAKNDSTSDKTEETNILDYEPVLNNQVGAEVQASDDSASQVCSVESENGLLDTDKTVDAEPRISLKQLLDIQRHDVGDDQTRFSRYPEPMLVLPDTFYAEVSSKNSMMFHLEIFAVGKSECLVDNVKIESPDWRKKTDRPVVCTTEMPFSVKPGKRVHLVFECMPEAGLIGKQDITIICQYNNNDEDSVDGTIVWQVSDGLYSWVLTPEVVFLPEERYCQHSLMLRDHEIEASPVLYENHISGLVPSETHSLFPKKVMENSETGRSLLQFEIPERIQAISWSRVFVTDCINGEGLYPSVSISSADPSGVTTEAWIMSANDGPKVMAPVAGSGSRIMGVGKLSIYAMTDSNITLAVRCEERYMKLHTDTCTISPGKAAHIHFSVLESAMNLHEARDLKLWVHDGINETLIPVPLQRQASSIRLLDGIKAIAAPYIPIGEKVPLRLMVPTIGPGEMDIEIGCDLFRHRWTTPIVGKGGGSIEWHLLECQMDTSLMHPVDRLHFIVTAISQVGGFYEQTVTLDSNICGLEFSIDEPQSYGRTHLLRFVKNPEAPDLPSANSFTIELRRGDNLPGAEIVWELLDGEAKTSSEAIAEIFEITGIKITRDRQSAGNWCLVREMAPACKSVRTVIIRAVSKPTGTGPELATSFSLLVPDIIQSKDTA